MHTIPLVKIQHILPFVSYIRKHLQEEKLYTLLSQCDIPISCLANPQQSVSEVCLWRLLDTASTVLAQPDFGLNVGNDIDIMQFGEFSQALQQAPTLFSCLSTFCELVSTESSQASFWLETSQHHLWFCRQGIKSIHDGQMHAEMYTMRMMEKVVALKLGADWQAKKVMLQSAKPSQAYIKMGSIQVAQPYTAIGIPCSEAGFSEQLKLTMHYDLDVHRVDIVSDLITAFTPYIGESDLSLEKAAYIAGMSTRTFQRALSNSRTNFKALLDTLKFTYAKVHMNRADMSFSSLSNALGYSDSAHFSRAFKQWSGMSPSQYKKANQIIA